MLLFLMEVNGQQWWHGNGKACLFSGRAGCATLAHLTSELVVPVEPLVLRSQWSPGETTANYALCFGSLHR